MAYGRGGFFRSRFIAPPSQRATEILSKPVITQARLDFEANTVLAGSLADNAVIALAPMTVAPAAGQERLVVAGGTTTGSGSAAVDFKACTIDGQVATRVGSISRATGVTGINRVVVSGSNGCVTTVNFGATAFGTAAPSGFSAWGSGTTLNPADKKSALVVLSNGNLTVTGTDTGGNNWARSTTAQTGKRYVEFTTTTVASTAVGVADPTTMTYPGSNAHSLGLYSNGFGGINGIFPDWGGGSGSPYNTYASGNVVGMAIDFTAKKLWWRVNGGNWNGSALNDPATGVGGIDIAAYASATTAFVTTYRAPGTSNTSISVTLTVNNLPGETVDNAYVACWKMSNVGTVRGSTFSNVFDPALGINTSASGAAVAGLLGYGSAAFSPGGATVWSNLTECADDTNSADIVFSTASSNLSSASTPLAISANVTPDLTPATTPTGVTASLALSFNPVLTSTVPALSGNYVMAGTPTLLTLAHKIAAAAGSYATTGTNATTRRGLATVAASASYGMTGQAASPNRSAGATASIVFDAAIADGANKINGEAYTFPLTVAASAGDRLVIVGGIAHALTGDFTACTIDGQIATRVGTVSRGQPDGSIAANSNAAFLTAYRAPGTASTSINVVATLASGGDGSFSGYCACFRTTGVGAVYASTNNNVNDPTLSTDTVSSGAVVAALLGYDLGGPPVNAVNWTGLTERFDDVNTAGVEVFSGASANISSGASPTVITADITPNLTTLNEDTIASIALSFVPSGSAGTTLAANPGVYVTTGQTALTLRGRKAAATTVGSYALAGTDATMHAQGRILAGPGAYVLTGKPAATIRSGANKLLDALPGAYAMTGTAAVIKRGTKISVTSVGAYNMTGTTPITTGMGLIAAAGSYAMTGTPASLVYRAGPNISIVVGTAPLTASAGTAVVHTTVGIAVSGSGNVATVSVGNPTVLFSGGVSVLVSAPGMTADVGTVAASISGGIEVFVNGFGLTADVGNVTVLIPARVTVTGNFMTASVGTALVNILGSANALVFGNQLDASVGSVTFTTNANMSVTGNSMTASVGTVDTFTLVGAVVSGNEMTASSGDVTVTAKQNTVVEVQGHALVAFVGTLDFAGGGTITHPNLKNREGRMLQPSNWMGA